MADDHGGMRLIDESPGLFLATAAVVVYSVIGVEIWMWTAESAVAVGMTLALVAAVALGIVVWMGSVLEDATTVERPEVEALAQEAATAAAEPVRERRVRPAAPRPIAH